MANEPTILTFEGIRNTYYYGYWDDDDNYVYTSYYAQENFRLYLEEQASGGNVVITVKAKAKMLESWYGYPDGYFDGQIVWRYKPTASEPNPSWQVVDSFSAQAAQYQVNFQYGTQDADGYIWLRNLSANADWSATITATAGKAIQVGFRPLPNSPAGYLKFGNTLDVSSSWYTFYAFSDTTDPVFQEYEAQGGGGVVYLDPDGTGFKAYTVWIDDGQTWHPAIPYVDNGTEWVPCG